MKKAGIALVGLVVAILLATVSTVTAVGNGWIGYHDNRIFVGTGLQWCQQKYPTWSGCVDYLGASVTDKITMKWNEAWDTCNAGGDCAGAWTDNEWNGKFKGGSGTVWHYKIKWVGTCTEGAFFADGGYCLWGAYEVTMDQGSDPTGHQWFAHATPNGYGA